MGRSPWTAADAPVRLLRAGQTTTSGDLGSFSFDDLDPGTYVLSARASKDAPPPDADDGPHLDWVRSVANPGQSRFSGAVCRKFGDCTRVCPPRDTLPRVALAQRTT